MQIDTSYIISSDEIISPLMKIPCQSSYRKGTWQATEKPQYDMIIYFRIIFHSAVSFLSEAEAFAGLVDGSFTARMPVFCRRNLS